MSSFEWMELQTLNAEITNARSRLSTARSHRDNRLARVLEEEITAAEQRRARLLAHITSQLASTGEPPLHPELLEDAAPDEAAEIEVTDDSEIPEPQPSLAPDNTAAEDELTTGSASEADPEGGSVVWDQLTPGDIERAKAELGTRRAEMLARHAEELRALDADQVELDTLVEAVAAFIRKFNVSSDGAAVVQLDDERESRMQSHG